MICLLFGFSVTAHFVIDIVWDKTFENECVCVSISVCVFAGV